MYIQYIFFLLNQLKKVQKTCANINLEIQSVKMCSSIDLILALLLCEG